VSERNPPYNPEAELATLGAMLLNSRAATTVLEELREEDYFRDANRHIFAAARTLYVQGEAVDLVTISSELRRRQKLEEVGGWLYLNELSQSTPTTANLALYIREVRDRSLLRQLISASSRFTNQAFLGAEAAEDILSAAERTLMEILSRGGSQKTYVPINEVLAEAYNNISHIMDTRSGITGIPSGFEELDRLTSGLQNSDLIIIAARPGVGKSTLLLNLTQHAAISSKIPTAFFSLEMSREQLAQRMLCAEAEVDLHNMRRGFLGDRDWDSIGRAVGPLSAAPIYIDDTGALSAMELRTRARRMRQELGVGLIVIDYLQLMTLGGRSENRQQEISSISRMLKSLAKELNIPIVVASQLSRAVEQRQDKRPMLSDLLESGGIEANADLVLFIYRDDYYSHQSSAASSSASIAELILAKQRNGPTGSVELFYLRQFNKFARRDKESDRTKPRGQEQTRSSEKE